MSETGKDLEKILASLKASSGSIAAELTDGNGIADPMSKAVPINAPYPFEMGDYSPNQKQYSLEEFIETAERLIRFGQELESNDASKYVSLIAEYPNEDFSRFNSGEVITWKVIRREPALLNAKATGRPARTYLHQRNFKSPLFPNKVVELETRHLDHVIEFTCYSKEASKANKRALWLERLFVNHSWAFTFSGADRFFFKERGSDNYRTTGGQPLYERCLRFDVRLIELRLNLQSEIKTIMIQNGISTDYLE